MKTKNNKKKIQKTIPIQNIKGKLAHLRDNMSMWR